jgi:hypothetical protein
MWAVCNPMQSDLIIELTESHFNLNTKWCTYKMSSFQEIILKKMYFIGYGICNW